MRKGVDSSDGGSPLTTGRGKEKKSINLKVCFLTLTISIIFLTQSQQWVEIQARRRKIPVADFLVLAENKKKETQEILEVL